MESSDKNCDLINLIKDKNDLVSIKHYAHKICSEYIGRSWKALKLDEFELTPLGGGLSNYLYICEIPDTNFKQLDDEPRKVILRLYGEIRGGDMLFNDIIVTTLIGQQKIGPKIYGVHGTHSRLEEYINASSLKYEDNFNSQITRSIAKKIADYHMLEMPISKESNWIFNLTEECLAGAENIEFKDEEKQIKHEIIKSYNMRGEYLQLKKVILSTPSAIVFCHNDLQMGNILSSESLEGGLMLIDYEFSCYSFRGFDFGNHFIERIFNNHSDVYPFFTYDFNKYPNIDEQKEFITAYIERFRSNLEHNKLKQHPGLANLNIDAIVNEANVCALIALLCTVPWALMNAIESSKKFDWLEFAIARADCYFKLKHRLFPSGYTDE